MGRTVDRVGLDDAICDQTPTGEHDWGLTEAHPTLRGADTVSTCERCGAVRYEPTQAARRPPL